MSTILVVDDERLICDLLRSVLAGHGHEVLIAMNGREGLELFKKHRPRFTLLDLRMPEMNGIEVLKQIRAIDPQAAVLILTAWGSDALEQQARQLGVVDFLSKGRSEEHTSELQSLAYLVCRLLLEKKKKTKSEMRSPRKSPHTRR